MPNPDINLSPYTAESEAIARRMKMAELLQQQSMQPLETPGMAGGYQLAVSPYAGLAKILQGYTAMQAGKGAEAERKALGERASAEATDWMKNIAQVPGIAGTPAQIYKPMDSDYQDNPNLITNDAGMATEPEQPGLPPRTRTLAEQQSYLFQGTQNPASAALANALLTKNIDQQEFQQLLNSARLPSANISQNIGSNTGNISANPPAPTGATGAPTSTGTNQNYNLSALAASGNARAQEFAKFMQNEELGKVTDKIKELRAAGVKPGSPQWIAALTNIFTAGGIYQINATGGVNLAEGFVAGAGAIKRAEEEAEAENEVVTKTVGGREVLGTNRQFRILATGNASTEEEARDVVAWANRNKIGASIGVSSTGGMPKGASGGGAPGQTGSVINPTAADSTYSAKRAESFSTMADKIHASWEIATKMNGMLDQLDLLYQDPNVTSGALAEKSSGLKGLAASLNIDIAGRSSEEAIQSITNRFALELRNPSGGAGMPGAMSDADRTFLTSIPPGLSKTPAGRALISQGMRAVNDRDRQIANMAQRYEERVGRLDNGFIKEMREWSDANPLLTPDVKRAMQVLMGRTK